jgi:hypothetical protein
MTSRKWLGIAAAAAVLGGCADYPYAYNDNTYYDNYPNRSYPSYSYYRDYPYYPYGYAPGYYVAPSLSFGYSYSSRPYYYRGRWYG